SAPERQRPQREPRAHELHRGLLRVRAFARPHQPQGAAVSSSSLALLGAAPSVTTPGPHFTWPPITEETTKAVTDQLAAGISIYDRSGVIEELEDALASYHGVRHAVLTSSGTAALYSMYAACELGPGMEVIVPAYTFFATVTPLLHLGAVPVLAD